MHKPNNIPGDIITYNLDSQVKTLNLTIGNKRGSKINLSTDF